jgi:hypothetical protein
MTKKRKGWTSVLAVCAAVALATIAYAGPKVGDTVTVRVLSAKVMKKPKFIGGTAGNVSRGDTLTIKKVKGAWFEVNGAASGWIHKSNVVEGKVELSKKPGGSSGGGASQDEVELAGRGFTPQVEDQYRGDNPELDFSHVDAIEKTEVDLVAVESFVNDGQLVADGSDQ